MNHRMSEDQFLIDRYNFDFVFQVMETPVLCEISFFQSLPLYGFCKIYGEPTIAMNPPHFTNSNTSLIRAALIVRSPKAPQAMQMS